MSSLSVKLIQVKYLRYTIFFKWVYGNEENNAKYKKKLFTD